MTFRALNDFVYIRKSPEALTKGGIMLLEKTYDEGVVIAVGPGLKRRKDGRRESMWDVQPGQRVTFSPNGNNQQRVDGEDLVVIRRDSLIGLVEGA
jgi:co-chaperonin GroES (HSP10)